MSKVDIDELVRWRDKCEALAASLQRKVRHCDEITEERDQMQRERDEARDELAKTSADFHDVWESRDKVIEERERARQACNAYWHDLTRIALLCAQTDDEYPLKAVERTVRERDEARAEVDHWRVKAEAYGGMVHGCGPALEAAGHPIDPFQPDGRVGGMRRSVDALIKERDEARAEVERLRAELRTVPVEFEPEEP